MNQLIPDVAFKPIFYPLQGQRAGVLFSPGGNTGDRLIELATMQLMKRFGVDCRIITAGDWTDLDVILCGGGGNFGHHACLSETLVRREAVNSGLPCILLPQTAYGTEWGWMSHRVYLRDRFSLTYHPGGTLAPDLVLGFRPAVTIPEPEEKTGRFYCDHPEAMFADLPNDGDLRYAHQGDPQQYIVEAGRYEQIITDSLHLAICGLIAGRRVTLLPSRGHKQRSTWQDWLADLGCEWSESPPG